MSTAMQLKIAGGQMNPLEDKLSGDNCTEPTIVLEHAAQNNDSNSVSISTYSQLHLHQVSTLLFQKTHTTTSYVPSSLGRENNSN